MPVDQRKVIESSLHRVAGGDTMLDHVLSESLQEVRVMKEKFQQNMTNGCAEARAAWQEVVAKEGATVRFEEYWEAGAVGFAEDLALPQYYTACLNRGFHGLLDLRPVRLCVGALMSLIFSQVRANTNQ
jgi:hypothetical protein